MHLHYHTIGRDIMAIDKYFKFYFKSALSGHHLNVAEGMVLLALYGRDGQTTEGILDDIHEVEMRKTQDQLIGELHYDKAAMTRTMQALEKKGLVLRSDNPLDSRSYLFSLTEQAKEFKEVLLTILRTWNDGILQELDGPTIALLENSLDSMMQNARRLAKDGKEL